MHGRNLPRGRCPAGTDGPDRLIGDGEVVRPRIARNAGAQLLGDKGLRLPCVADGFGLADAQNDAKPGAPGPHDLFRNNGIGFGMILTAFGVTENYV